MAKLLITGGAGYVGSHCVLAAIEAGHDVTVLDDLSTGYRDAIPADISFVQGNAGDQALVTDLFSNVVFDAVIHFAGSVIVPESIENPLKYYENNTVVSRNLIACCIAAGIQHFLFSSTAAVYGMQVHMPVDEDMPPMPTSPYGTSKMMIELMLRDAAVAHHFHYAALRYFNVAGADQQGRAGQRTKNATHLIKIAMQAALGKRDHVQVFGTDYNTPDGTGVRDYIHVSDLADLHIRMVDHLMATKQGGVFNCGYGRGYSVLEVLNAVQRVSGVDLQVEHTSRRAGDMAELVANTAKLRKQLNWQPKHDDLDVIIKNALDFEKGL